MILTVPVEGLPHRVWSSVFGSFSSVSFQPKEQKIVVYYEWIKRNLKTKYIWGVGVMKDYNLTLRNLRASHTLSWTEDKSASVTQSEVELQESEELKVIRFITAGSSIHCNQLSLLTLLTWSYHIQDLLLLNDHWHSHITAEKHERNPTNIYRKRVFVAHDKRLRLSFHSISEFSSKKVMTDTPFKTFAFFEIEKVHFS